ncbi:taurine catabolism dioxygenase [Veronia pacifica]|uniref:Taurine catabolism dioxygenase n=1 Tax=Veronia pacifica TaxID=1080227 RepID=A0A1C3EBH9_9GAMM|nr:taurine catabolism dioxygenase [Veronia pacifica]
MNVVPINPFIGANISGVDLNVLSDSDFDIIYQAFLKHKVIFFRDQCLEPEHHLALAQRFGCLEEPHPFFPHVDNYPQISVIETTRGNPPGESFWHTDMTWQAAPPKCSILFGSLIPNEGGDTIWVSMEAVLNTLPLDIKERVMNLTAVHGLHAFEGSRFDSKDEKGQSSVAEKSKSISQVTHPMIARHPETGLETLYINEQFTRCVNGLDDKESQTLLKTLYGVARQPEFQVRFQWQKGSVAIWDNRCTQHFAVTDYGDTPRRLHRVTVIGEPVIPA